MAGFCNELFHAVFSVEVRGAQREFSVLFQFDIVPVVLRDSIRTLKSLSIRKFWSLVGQRHLHVKLRRETCRVPIVGHVLKFPLCGAEFKA